MRQIRSTGMAPEIAVRKLVHGLGFRFRLHQRELPGKPDLILTRHRKVIFVHGCFWHQHAGCREGRLPGTRLDYWKPKLNGNQVRDARNLRLLRKAGWKCLVVWECQTKKAEKLSQMVTKFLNA